MDELRGRNATTLQNQTVTARQQYDEPKPRTSRVFLLACLSPRLGYRCRYPAYILGGATEVHATADKTPFAVSQYTLTADDLSKSLTHNSRLRICITIAVLFGSLTVAAQMFITDGYFLGTITVLFGFLCVSFVLFTHRRLAKNYIASLDGDLEVTVEYSNHGISIADSKSELTLEWTAIENTERDASGLFFNLRGGHNIFVPERGLPDNHVLARIEQLIASRTAG